MGLLFAECDVTVAVVGVAAFGATHLFIAGVCGSSGHTPTGEERRNHAHVLGHQAASLLAVSILGIVGALYWYLWMGDMHSQVAGFTSSSERFLVSFPPSVFIGEVNVAFQVYDFMATALVPKLRSPIMLAHHVMAGSLAALTCYPRAFGIDASSLSNYDLMFFFGVTELSTVPLAVHDALKLLPLHLKTYPSLNLLNEVCKPLFAFIFLAVRCVHWPFVMGAFGSMHLDMFLSDAPTKPVHAFYIVMSSAMTVLQYFWGFKIVTILISVAMGSSGSDKKNHAKKSE